MAAAVVWSYTALAMLAFAANSLLCRMALAAGLMDAASFSSVRLASGAAVLALLLHLRPAAEAGLGQRGSWPAAFALFIYAVGFAFAYLRLDTATGALILFAAVQLGMIGVGLWSGERFRASQWLGLACAVAGVVALLAPAATRPHLPSAALMALAGLAWAYYSLAGRQSRSALAFTTGNFVRSSLLCLPLLALYWPDQLPDSRGLWLAVGSGALASGMGYAIWYAVLPALPALTASGVQLSVPILAALMGVLVLNESLTGTLIVASIAVLAGIALVIRGRAQVTPSAADK